MTQVQTRTSEQTPSATTSTGRRNRTAIWALVLAILTLGGVGSILGMVLGVKARHQVQQSGERGFSMATAAIVVGLITLVFAIVYWIVIAQHFGGGGTGGGGGGESY